MTQRERKIVKKAVQFLKIARSLDHIGFRAMVGSEAFAKEVLEALERVCQWNDTDEKETKKLAAQFHEGARGRTLREKRERLSRIIKYGGGIAAALGIVGGMAYRRAKRRATKNAAE
ncbi:hypothetical protein D6833_01255 [Candidatus Parcubacteria bacterium]|nr:MAG: hypothetical protein D6833_01255 [Candidatus Parcubacteria bacterium]